jgi:serine/threonine protein kinase
MAERRGIGKYEILEEIGRGGFAKVYKARDTDLGRVVALKVLHPHLTTKSEFTQRFRQQARMAARLSHPHIVTIHDIGEEAKRHYLAMTFVPDHWQRLQLCSASLGTMAAHPSCTLYPIASLHVK